MTPNQIDHLITRRNKLTNRRDGWIDFKRVDAIDAKLQQVPAGQRNDVDLLLGRMCARIVDVLEADDARQAARWSTDEQRGEWKVEAEVEAAQQAEAKMREFHDWQERGAGCAGNSADEYSSDTEGRW